MALIDSDLDLLIPEDNDNSNSFQQELESLINSHCRENNSNTPDFILANYMLRCLQAFEDASNQREQWYGKKLEPAQVENS